jgi:TPR repeat protein
VSTDAVNDEADALRQAAEAGDAEAMWEYALRLVGTTLAPLGPGDNLFAQLHAVAGALRDGRHHRARDWVGRAADAGNLHAMVVEADLLERADRQRAERLAGQAAERGDPAAMLYLGRMLAGDGNRAAARDWYTRLADRGDHAGMALLGELLLDEDPQAARNWLHRAADLGNLRARNELAMLAAQDSGQPLDPAHPPAKDPRETGLFGPRTPVSRRERLIADCAHDGRNTIQDVYEVILGPWLGLTARLPMPERNTAGKIGRRMRFTSCTVCGCLYPADDRARRYVQARGGEFLNPAKLSPQRRARAARAMRPRLAGGASVLAFILGVAAFFAAPAVWGVLGILLGVTAYRGRQKFGAVAAGVAALGLVVGLVLHYHHPFGYG